MNVRFLKDSFLGFLKQEQIESVINPMNINLLEGPLRLTSTLLKEGGEEIVNDLMNETGVPGKALVTRSYDLKKSNNIKYLVHTILPEPSAPLEILQSTLQLCYQNALKEVSKKKIKCLAIPFLENNAFNLDVNIQLNIALSEIGKFIIDNPSINVYFIFENLEIYNLYQNLVNPDANQKKLKESKDNINSMAGSNKTKLPVLELDDEEDEIPSLEVKPTNTTDFSLPPTPTNILKLKREFHYPSADINKPEYKPLDEIWQIVAVGEIGAAITNNKLDTLKFFLGPALFLIRSQYQFGILNEIEWEIFKLQHLKSSYKRALEGSLIYLEFIKHQLVIALGEIPDLVSTLESDIKQVYQIQKNNNEALTQYQTSINEKISDKLRQKIAIQWQSLKKDRKNLSWEEDNKYVGAGSLSENGFKKNNFTTQLNLWMDIWFKGEVLNSKYTTNFNTRLEIIHMNMKGSLFDKLNLSQNIQNFIDMIEQECKALSRQIRYKKEQYQKEAWYYQHELNKTIAGYKKSATIWLKDEKNFKSLPARVYQHQNPEEIINSIIAFNSSNDLTTFPESSIQVFFNMAEEKEAYTQELEKHFLSPRYKNIAEVAKKLHNKFDASKEKIQALEEKLSASLEEVDNSESDEKMLSRIQNETSKAITKILEDSHTYLATHIEDPYTWDELTKLLSFIACKSEAQQLLKSKLTIFLEARNPKYYSTFFSTIGFNSKELLHRRREVQYLISCLYLASATDLDEGILFSARNELHYQVGVNYVLSSHQNGASSYLLSLLRGFIAQIRDEKIPYLTDSVTTNPLNEYFTSFNVVKAATKPVMLSAPIYEEKSVAIKPTQLGLTLMGASKNPLQSSQSQQNLSLSSTLKK